MGEWLPEPLVAGADDDPARKAEMADSLSLAFLVVLESLSPEQRAAFLLREVFGEPSDRIAEIVSTSRQNARQPATRARRRVERRRPRFEASREQREELATRFFAAAEEGGLQAWRQWHTALWEYPLVGRQVLRRCPRLTRYLLRHWVNDPGIWEEAALDEFVQSSREPPRAHAGQELHWQYVREEQPDLVASAVRQLAQAT